MVKKSKVQLAGTNEILPSPRSRSLRAVGRMCGLIEWSWPAKGQRALLQCGVKAGPGDGKPPPITQHQ